MALYAWKQDLPIDADTYAAITARMGRSTMPGLITHVAIEKSDGLMQYLDVWESQRAHDAAMAQVVHPAVRPVLLERGIQVAGEPPRIPITVRDVRFADGSSIRG